ncbi:MAG: efflux RND transporter periplasmic adaptor subunit [Candidatus Zixiibacteriota bacterium]
MVLKTIKHMTIAAALFLAGCGGTSSERSAEKAGEVRKVTMSLAERKAALDVQKIMGTVEARSHAQIETKVQARVERIAVNLGSHVRAGDLLAELDTRDFSARVRQAQALNEQAAQDLKRFESLLSQQAATRQEFDAVKARAAVAEANRQEAEAMLSYARIVAPFAGLVTEKYVDVGDLAIPGRPLFGLEQDGQLRFVLTIPESQSSKLAEDDSVLVEVPAADMTVTGLVSEISPSANPATRTYEIKIDLSSSGEIRPGQFGRLLLPSGSSDGLFVPSAAIVKRGQLELVYVVSADNRVALRMIRSGRQLGGNTEILSGLSAGETVVTSDAQKLANGDQVERQL